VQKKRSSPSMSTGNILWRSIRLGLKVKTPISLMVSVMAIPAALLPLLLSRQLQTLTDQLVALAANNGVEISDVGAALLMLGGLFLLQELFRSSRIIRRRFPQQTAFCFPESVHLPKEWRNFPR